MTNARFANVAFSNGSLPDGWIHRLQKKQPLAAPSDVKRYFVSPEESGQICMLACILGNGGEVFFPKLGEDQMLTFSAICDDFVTANKLVKHECGSQKTQKLSILWCTLRVIRRARRAKIWIRRCKVSSL